jgi:hypothetical protein
LKPSVAEHCCIDKNSKCTTGKERVRVLVPKKTVSFEAWRREKGRIIGDVIFHGEKQKNYRQ